VTTVKALGFLDNLVEIQKGAYLGCGTNEQTISLSQIPIPVIILQLEYYSGG
jgi:hypothetical protein